MWNSTQRREGPKDHPDGKVIQIYCGDYRDALGVLADQSVDLVVMDPPYGTTNIVWDKMPDLAELWAHLHRVCKPEAIIASFCAQPFMTDLIVANRRNFRYELIWEKARAVGFLDANRRPLRAHENIAIFCQKLGKSKYRAQLVPGKPYTTKNEKGSKPVHYSSGRLAGTTVNTGTRHPRSVLKHAQPVPSLHPTQKPLELVEWLIKSYSDLGDLVIDPFMGSGTTIVAAQRTGRRALGAELSADYLKVAKERLKAAA